MASQQLRIFPHSPDEFPTEDSLRTWLLTALPGRGGVYHLRDVDAVKSIPPGSVVLFRYGNRIVGDAIVWKDKEVLPQGFKDRTLTGEVTEYEAKVTFGPSTIRLYAPPVSVERLQPHMDHKDVVKFPGAYTHLDWALYGIVLQEVISSGTFIT